MDKGIQEKLIQYRYHLTIAILVSFGVAFLSYVVPRMLTILTYFWPLLASTTVFLVVIIAFGGGTGGGGLSQLATSTEAHGQKTGEGLLDYYVAAQQPQQEHPDYDQGGPSSGI